MERSDQIMQKPLAETAQIMGCGELDLIFVEAIVRHAKTSFAAGMKMLSPERRYSMFALYSFCRIVDDIADDMGEPEVKQKQLQKWRDKIELLYNGKADGSVENVLLGSIQRFGLRKEDFLAIIDGMEMDVLNPVIAPDEANLDLYCDRVASAVGRLAIRIFGDSSEAAEKVAYHLGRALQITNILRDLEEDIERGRLYLPKELLERFHISLIPERCMQNPSIQEVCNIMSYRALDHFHSAANYMKQCKVDAIRPAKIMAATYRFLLGKQKKLGWKKPFKRASLSTGEKVIVGMAGLMV